VTDNHIDQSLKTDDAAQPTFAQYLRDVETQLDRVTPEFRAWLARRRS
jgi:hypothetical protein